MQFRIRLLFLFIWFICALGAQSQISENIELVSSLPLSSNATDIWGFVDSNENEYAIVGSESGVHIIAIDKEGKAKELKFIGGDGSRWRDIKSYKNFVFVIADEGNDGLLVIDMSQPLEDIPFAYFNDIKAEINGVTREIHSCHNLYIDEDGYLYMAGCNIGRKGVIIMKIEESLAAPSIESIINTRYSHDVYVQNGFLYTSDIFAGVFTIYNVEDKSNPQRISEFMTSGNFTHNAWLSTDGNTLFTTDEIDNGFVEAYDIRDPSSITFLDKIQSDKINNENIVVHNVHVKDNHLYISHYTEGVVIVDSKDPNNLIEVGYYDTFLDEDKLSGSFFNGCWGVYPFLPSGFIIASDIESGLFVLKPTLPEVIRIEGRIIREDNKVAISGAETYFNSRPDLINQSDLKGNFKSGTSQIGEELLVVDHPLFDKKSLPIRIDTITAELVIELSSVDLTITSDNTHLVNNIQVKIIDESTNKSIDHSFLSSETLELPISKEKIYTLVFSAWGMKEIVLTSKTFTQNSNVLKLEPERGFEDSFTLDNNWNTSSLASAGNWERGLPVRKIRDNILLQPNFDSPNDIGNICYFTDLSGGGRGTGDVDDGTVFLRSPIIDASNFSSSIISFDYFFSNSSGNSPLNDSLNVYLEFQDATLYPISRITSSSIRWNSIILDTLIISEFPDSKFKVLITASDLPPEGHVVEAGFDNLKVELLQTTSLFDPKAIDIDWTLYPNIIRDAVNVTIHNHQQTGLNFELYDTNGNLIFNTEISSNHNQFNLSMIPPGFYFARLYNLDNGIASSAIKLIKIK